MAIPVETLEDSLIELSLQHEREIRERLAAIDFLLVPRERLERDSSMRTEPKPHGKQIRKGAPFLLL